jgi:hypothetical protein
VEGSAWLGLTPFRVERFGVFDLPAVPVVTSFNETNVRTDVRGPDGRDGIWFFSLDVDSLVNVGGGRMGGLPYYLSAMSVQLDDHVRYRCRRRLGGRAHHDITVGPGGPVSHERELADLLTGRWRAYHVVGSRLVEVPRSDVAAPRSSTSPVASPYRRAGESGLWWPSSGSGSPCHPLMSPAARVGPRHRARSSRPRAVGRRSRSNWPLRAVTNGPRLTTKTNQTRSRSTDRTERRGIVSRG